MKPGCNMRLTGKQDKETDRGTALAMKRLEGWRAGVLELRATGQVSPLPSDA